jgi:hypothetical protein
MKKVLNKLLIFFLLSTFFCSCINNDYDTGNIDDGDVAGLSPALTLPIGSLNIKILEFIKSAGIESVLHGTDADTIYVTYGGQMSLNLKQEIPGWSNQDVFYVPPYLPNIGLGFDGGEESIDIDVFENLKSNGSELYPSNPQIYLTIRNYIGADIDVKINGITSYGNGEERYADFNNSKSYIIDIGKAPAPHQSTTTKATFNRTNGKLHELFKIAPERISYDFDVDLPVPDDGSLFLVLDKFVDIDYEIKIPFTFSEGTRLSNVDTLKLDLSGDDFISNLDEFILWIDYENRLHASVNLEIEFLDKYKTVIPDIKKVFNMKSAPVYGGTNQSEAEPSKDSFTLTLDDDEVDAAKETRFITLKYMFQTGSGEVNIHPSDYVNLKLSAYLKVNL